MEKIQIERRDLMDIALACMPRFWHPYGNRDAIKIGDIVDTFEDNKGVYCYEFENLFLCARTAPAWVRDDKGFNHLAVATGNQVFERALDTNTAIWVFIYARWSYMVYYPETLAAHDRGIFKNNDVLGRQWEYIFFDEQHVSERAQVVFNKHKAPATATAGQITTLNEVQQ